MANRDITSANSKIILICPELFPIGVELQQFSTDQSITQGDEEMASDRIGVDGKMVAGWVPTIKSVTIALEASSPSASVFDTIYKHSKSAHKVYWINLIVTVPSLGKVIVYKNGVLKNWKLMPDHKQVLDPINAVIDFESVE